MYVYVQYVCYIADILCLACGAVMNSWPMFHHTIWQPWLVRVKDMIIMGFSAPTWGSRNFFRIRPLYLHCYISDFYG